MIGFGLGLQCCSVDCLRFRAPMQVPKTTPVEASCTFHVGGSADCDSNSDFIALWCLLVSSHNNADCRVMDEAQTPGSAPTGSYTSW